MKGKRYLQTNGRNVYINPQNGKDNQAWYFDQKSKTIKSKRFNKSLDIQNAGRSRNLQIWNTNGGWF